MNNKNLITLIAIILVLAAGIFAYRQIRQPRAAEDAGKYVPLAVKTSEGAVGMEVQPVLKSGATEVQIGLSTHSGDLGMDLTKAVELADDKGGVYKAMSWQGPPPGGHHISGTLIFPEIKSGATKLTLSVQSMNGEPAQVFAWEIPQ